jgi:hypothetical protein
LWWPKRHSHRLLAFFLLSSFFFHVSCFIIVVCPHASTPFILAYTAMRRVLGIRGGQGETLVPPTAVEGGDEGFVFEFEASDDNNSAANYAVLW